SCVVFFLGRQPYCCYEASVAMAPFISSILFSTLHSSHSCPYPSIHFGVLQIISFTMGGKPSYKFPKNIHKKPATARGGLEDFIKISLSHSFRCCFLTDHIQRTARFEPVNLL